jgi:hypothetical protein
MNKEAMCSSSTWQWTPLKSVGDIPFNAVAELILQKYKMKRVESIHGEDEWDTYGIAGGGLEVYVEDSRIEGVGCFDNLYYQGRNIIGMEVDEVKCLLGEPDDTGEKEIGGRPLYYEKYAASLFEVDGKIVSCMVSASWDD